MVSEASTAQKKKQIAIYSDDSSVRAAVILALGNRIAEDLPEHEQKKDIDIAMILLGLLS